jgi:hypothetical protein
LNHSISRGRDEKDFSQEVAGRDLKDVDEGFTCFVDLLAIGLEGHNVSYAFVAFIAAVFDGHGHELNFEVWVVFFEGFLEDIVDTVAVVNSSIHVADESGGDHVVCSAVAECTNPDVVVSDPHEEISILLHHAAVHRRQLLGRN